MLLGLSYIAYTPWLDQLNAAFFESAARPEFIIWDEVDLKSIDGRHLLNDKPQTIYAILKNYAVASSVDGRALILRRAEAPQLSSPSVGDDSGLEAETRVSQERLLKEGGPGPKDDGFFSRFGHELRPRPWSDALAKYEKPPRKKLDNRPTKG